MSNPHKPEEVVEQEPQGEEESPLVHPLEILAKASSDKKKSPKKLGSMLIGWTVLFISLVGGSCSGLFYYYMQMECQLIKNAWRLFLTSLMILPFALIELKRKIDTDPNYLQTMKDPKYWKAMIIGSLGHTTWSVGLLISVNHTTMAHAYLFHSMHMVIIAFMKFFKGASLLREEILGTLLATFGSIFLAMDHDVGSSSIVNLAAQSPLERFLLGDMVSLLSAIGGALFFTKTHEISQGFPTYTRVSIMSFMGSLIVATLSITFEGATFSMDPQTGLFALLTERWFHLALLHALISGLGSYVCYQLSTKYFDPLLVSVVCAAEPVVSALLVFFLGWQSFPGLLTWVGFAVILPSVIIISIAQNQNQNK